MAEPLPLSCNGLEEGCQRIDDTSAVRANFKTGWSPLGSSRLLRFSGKGIGMGLFAKQRRRLDRDVGELEQELSHTRERNEILLITIRSLYYFVKEFSLDLTEIGAEKFKQSIDTLSQCFTSEEKRKSIEQALDESKHAIAAYIKRVKEYLHDRETEFKNIIDLLSSSIQTLSGDNADFHMKMYKSSSRLEEIAQLNDLRRIKDEMRREMEQIRSTIKEKQQRDEQRLEALAREVEGLRVDFQKAKQASMTDGLTGVFNRAAFDRQLAKRIDHHLLSATPFCLLMIDIDNFKQINDTYGHQVGDRVILAVAQECQGLIRKDDFLARYGGEEFTLILPNTSLRHGLKKAKAMCKTIANARYSVDTPTSRATMSFTVSIGVSAYQPHDTAESCIERADKALYEAKHLGKNRAVSEKRLGW